MDIMNEWYKVLAGLGAPSFFAMLAFIIKLAKNVSILMKAQQADMRHELLADYHKFMKRGEITDDEMKDWEARYQAYHQLGQNGVLDKKREDLLSLPNVM